MDYDLLPSNATAFERAFSLSTDALEKLSPGVASIRTAKMVQIPDAFVPFLIYEYGLGEVSAYVADPRELLVSGIDWQRVRGTPGALAIALGWLGYAAAIEEAPARRARWNLFHLALDRVRDAEAPDLERIEGVAGLSVPVRSRFWRGYHGHDVRELEWSRKRWGRAAWASSSGVRLRPDGAKWSFGRGADFTHRMTTDELTDLGAWQPYPDAGTFGWGLRVANTYVAGASTWGEFTWDGSPATWGILDDEVRASLIASALSNRPLWAKFRRADGSVIGHRRARVARPVAASATGPYSVGGERLAPADGAGESFYAEFLTDFGNGAGQDAATVSLLFDATPLDASRPGLMWAGPDALSPGVEVAAHSINIPLGATVRERLRFNLTF